MTNIAVFGSGTGTNFDAIAQAIDKKQVDACISLVVCDHKDALIVEKAKRRNIEVFAFDPKSYDSKASYEQEIVELCKQHNVSWIVLAGYMRLCGDVLLGAYENKILNIHPSLLPAFKGKDAIGQAIAYGVKVAGVTIHFVDQSLDGGKIIAQRSINIDPSWDRGTLESSIHAIEHQLYPEVLQQLVGGNK